MDFGDPYFNRVAMLESGGRLDARNPRSSATGPFQFISSTAKAYGLNDPTDPNQALRAMQAFTDDNRNALRQKLGREPTPGELYLAHQQGAGGATALLSNPQARAVDIVGPDAITLNGGRPDMTAGEFANKWVSKFENNGQDFQMANNLMEVELPDGTILEGVPAGISRAELLDRLKRNGMDTSGLETPQAATIPEAVQAEAPKLKDATQADEMAQQKKPFRPGIPKDDYSTPGNAALSALRRLGSAARTGIQGATFGLGDEIQAGVSTLPAWALLNLAGQDISIPETYNKALDFSRDELEQMRSDFPIQSLATEIGGGVLTGGAVRSAAEKAAPGAMSALSRYAASNPVKSGAATAAGAGGIYGFNEGEDGFGERAENAAISGAFAVPFGAGGGYLAGKIGSRGASLADDVADDLNDIVPTGFVKDAGQKSKTSALARLTTDQQARSAALEQAGIPRSQQTAAMITRDPKQWQFEQNTRGVSGVGDELRNRYVQANQAIRESLNKIGVKLGGKATTPYEAGESVTEAVIKKSREMQDDVGKLYGKIRESVGDNVGLQPGKILGALDEASDNAYADNVVNSMLRKMKRYGVVDKDGAPVQGASLSVKNAEELRKFANSLRGDKQTDGIVKNIIDALDDDVIETAGDDAFKAARDAARARFAEFETKILKGIDEGRLVSDDILNKTVFGGKVKDLQKLRESLTSGTEEQAARGAQAWGDLKLQTLQKVIDDSTSAGGKLQGSAFTRQLDKIGKERLETVFDPEELLQIRTIQKALEYTTVEVPESVVNYSGTGAANVNNALAGILQRSKLGEFMEKGSEAAGQIPVLGTVASPVFRAVQGGGRLLQDAARRKSVQNSLNPESALRRLADPSLVGASGLSGGVMGNFQNLPDNRQ